MTRRDFLAGAGALAGLSALPSSAASPVLPSQADVVSTIQLVNNYWIANNNAGNNDWPEATYFTGDLAAYDVTGQGNYLSFAQSWAQAHGYGLINGPRTTYANYQAAGQVYIRLYQIQKRSSDLTQISESVSGMVSSSVANEWYWIDAINMSAPCFAELGSIYNKTNYYSKMYQLYCYPRYTLGLYDTSMNLWWENSSYANTGTYWSRGNGWVFAALAKVLSVLPSGNSNYQEYQDTFQAMASVLLPLQTGGYWNPDLLGTDGPESSGTAFFLFGMAWGINAGVLERTVYLPAVVDAWDFFVNTAIQSSGFLGYVQPSGSGPAPAPENNTEDFGVGAFLLAAKQMWILAG